MATLGDDFAAFMSETGRQFSRGRPPVRPPSPPRPVVHRDVAVIRAEFQAAERALALVRHGQYADDYGTWRRWSDAAERVDTLRRELSAAEVAA